MFKDLTRRDFIKTISMGALAMALPVEVFASPGKADLVVCGKIFTAEGKLAQAFAVKNGKFVYVGDKHGVKDFVGSSTEVIDFTDKGLVMPSCGNGHAHYSMGHAIQSAGTVMSMDTTPEQFLTEIVPAAVKKARDAGATAIFGFGWNLMKF